MTPEETMDQDTQTKPRIGGVAGWLLARLRRESRPARRLILHERISLGPRQHLALVEADGRRFLIATGADGAPAFHPLDQIRRENPASTRRVSW